MNEDEDDKSKELPIGKETEANLFKSRSIFIYGGITQELAQKVCTQARGSCRRQRRRHSRLRQFAGRPCRIG